jgi:peptide/nickel transport system substrate-binding protein
MRAWRGWVAGVAVAMAAGIAASGGAAGAHSGPRPGGVYRVAFESAFGFTDGFDPTGEYYTFSWAIESNLMIRTLVGYNHVAGPAGNVLVPDIATSVPKPTDGGTTYTLHIKKGVKFGPPVNRQVTSADVLYAMERIAHPKDGAEYPFYYTVIKGFEAYGAGKAKSITGISTPNPRTIVFHLTTPTGDFLYRLAMPATAPIPVEVAKCFEGQAGKYGRDVVSTGPYMIAGAEKIDDSSCAKLKPMSGYDGQTIMTLVRNPDYDAQTDSPAARQSLPDEFQFTIDPNVTDIVDRVGAGELEDENAPSLPSQALEQYATDSAKKPYLHLNPGDLVDYLTMNVTQPPFDDIRVRKAMNWIMDKGALRQIWGGPLLGKIAGHIVPDSIFDNQLADYDPYATAGEHGSLAKAKEAMKGSKYDTKHDGMCTAAACHHVLLLVDTASTYQRMLPIVEADAAKIGITFHVSTIAGAYPTLQTTSKNIPFATFPGWAKDYADALTYFQPIFSSHSIIPQGNTNYALVGLRASQAKSLGVSGNIQGVPSVDAQLARCAALADQARLSCYEALDRTMMTKVVPWVPYLFQNAAHIVGPKVTQWQFDQFSSGTAYAHVAVSS